MIPAIMGGGGINRFVPADKKLSVVHGITRLNAFSSPAEAINLEMEQFHFFLKVDLKLDEIF